MAKIIPVASLLAAHALMAAVAFAGQPLPEPVIGLRLAGQQKAYPISSMGRQQVVNDEVGRLAVLVFYDSDSDYAAAFFRLVAGEPLEFSPRAAGLVADDLTTSTRWDMMSGEGISGNLVGMKLVPLPVTRDELGEWLSAYPSSGVWQP